MAGVRVLTRKSVCMYCTSTVQHPPDPNVGSFPSSLLIFIVCPHYRAFGLPYFSTASPEFNHPPCPISSLKPTTLRRHRSMCLCAYLSSRTLLNVKSFHFTKSTGLWRWVTSASFDEDDCYQRENLHRIETVGLGLIGRGRPDS